MSIPASAAVTLVNCFHSVSALAVQFNGTTMATGGSLRVPLFATVIITFSANASVTVNSVVFLPQGTSTVTVVTYASHQHMVLAHLLYNGPAGVAYLIPNGQACAFMSSFGLAGFYANPAQNMVLVPAVPINIAGSPDKFAFIQDLATGCQRISADAGDTTNAVCLTDPSNIFGTACTYIVLNGSVPAYAFAWAGVVKGVASHSNFIISTTDGTTMTFYGVGGAKQTGSMDCITYPGLVNNDLPANLQLVFTPRTQATEDNGRQVCATDTMYGCVPGKEGSCAVVATGAGAAYCGVPTLSVVSSAPVATWNVAVFNALPTGTVAATITATGKDTATGAMLLHQPFITSGYTSSSSVQLSLSIAALSATVSTFACTLSPSQCGALPWFVTGSACVEYASVTVWYEPVRSTVFVYLYPQTYGGHLPLYGFLPSASGVLPATWTNGGAVAVAPGTIFTVDGLTLGGGSYVLITSSVSGLLHLFAWKAAALTPIVVTGGGSSGGGTMTLGAAYAPTAAALVPYFQANVGVAFGVMASASGGASLLYTNPAGQGSYAVGSSFVPATSKSSPYGYSPFEACTLRSTGVGLPDTFAHPASASAPGTVTTLLPAGANGPSMGVPAWATAIIITVAVALLALGGVAAYNALAKDKLIIF